MNNDKASQSHPTDNQTSDLLDNEVFTCCKCGGLFRAIDGTWLPIGEEDKSQIQMHGELPTILEYGQLLRPPETIYSDDFTCYNCL